MKALLIIDMQVGSFKPATPRFDTEGVINRINLLSSEFRSKGNPVIFIQHDGSRDNEFVPGFADWEILSSLEKSSADLFVSKIANDSFYNTDLQKILKELNVEELYISGCATDFCVDSTIKSALNKDFHVKVVKDAHTTANRPQAGAEIIINHYNWIWENLIATKGSVRVVPFDKIMQELKA